MEQFTFEELNQLKTLSVRAQKYELAAKVLDFIKSKFGKEESMRMMKINYERNYFKFKNGFATILPF